MPGFAPLAGRASGWLAVQPPAKGFFDSLVSLPVIANTKVNNVKK